MSARKNIVKYHTKEVERFVAVDSENNEYIISGWASIKRSDELATMPPAQTYTINREERLSCISPNEYVIQSTKKRLFRK